MGRNLILLICLIATFQSSMAQIDQDAVMQLFNVTFQSGGISQIASTTTEAYDNLSAALSNTLGTNTEIIQNACSFSGNPCDPIATCVDVNATLGIFQCSCPSGYNMSASTLEISGIIPDGTNCPEIDECAGNTTVCGPGTDQCFNSPGSYSCNCSAGYSYNSATQFCDDINECSNSSLNNCDMNATCTNSDSTFSCTCNNGFSGDGVNCTEIDQCVEQNITCGGNGVCMDPINQTYSCNCNTGYEEITTVDPITCQDIDECMTNTDNCDANATCTNTAGSFTCTCNAGYTGNGVTCSDIDECASNPCDGNATCTNSAGSFTCTCNTGYSGNGTFCEVSPATVNFCFRLSITFGEATMGDTTTRASDSSTAVTDFLNELVNGNVGFSFDNSSDVLEAVEGNNTVTEFIVELCLNGSSVTADGFEDILRSFNFVSTVNSFGISVLDFNECLTNYGNCSVDASCSNTNGSFTCACLDTHSDQSMMGMSGTVCELPTNFTCSSNTVNVTAYNPYFSNLGINNTELYLGNCPGTLQGDLILYAGECNAVIESNTTHISYNWNLTNVNESSQITVGNYVTIPITCTFLSSQNVSFNISSERRDILFNDDLNNQPGSAYDFSVETFQDSATALALSGPVNTDTAIFFRVGTTNTLPSNVRIQIERFTTSAANDNSFSLTLINNGCPEAATDVNRRVLNTLSIIRNGITSSALVRVDSHFFGQSTVTLATFEVNACVESGGASSCEYNCGGSRRRRSLISYRVKRQEIEETGRVFVAIERDNGDECVRDCGVGGICVFDSTRTEQFCVCADGYTNEGNGVCRENIASTNSDISLSVTTIALIILAILLVLLFGILIVVLVLRRRRSNRKQYDMPSYANTSAIDSARNE